MDALALCVTALFDSTFAVLSIPLIAGSRSNQVRTTILIAAALASLYTYRNNKSQLPLIDFILVDEKYKDLVHKSIMMTLRIVFIVSAVLAISGYNMGPRTMDISKMLS